MIHILLLLLINPSNRRGFLLYYRCMENVFENPLMVRVCEVLNLDSSNLPDRLLLEYSEGKCYAKFYDFSEKGTVISPYKKKRIFLDCLLKLLVEFMKDGDMPFPDVIGTDCKSIYDSVTHREVLDMRVFFPTCFIQVSYADEVMMVDFSEVASGSLRDRLQVEID